MTDTAYLVEYFKKHDESGNIDGNNNEKPTDEGKTSAMEGGKNERCVKQWRSGYARKHKK